MRIAGAFLLATTMLTGAAARAGSIQYLEAAQEVGPSMLLLGAQTGATPSPSMIAFGEPAANVDGEKAAAIATDRHPHRNGAMPVVMRGGIVGGAFATSASNL